MHNYHIFAYFCCKTPHLYWVYRIPPVAAQRGGQLSPRRPHDELWRTGGPGGLGHSPADRCWGVRFDQILYIYIHYSI